MSETALKTAITALLAVHRLDSKDNLYACIVSGIIGDALRELQREHYLGEPSPATQEELVGVNL